MGSPVVPSGARPGGKPPWDADSQRAFVAAQIEGHDAKIAELEQRAEAGETGLDDDLAGHETRRAKWQELLEGLEDAE